MIRQLRQQWRLHEQRNHVFRREQVRARCEPEVPKRLRVHP